MFMIPMGLMAGADVSVLEMFYKNFIPVTLGNAFAGSFIVAMGYSYAFGRLGSNTASHLPVSRVSREDLSLDAINQREKEQNASEMADVPGAALGV
eukprot:7059787-Heterocapsa_arctica.AAC.1